MAVSLFSLVLSFGIGVVTCCGSHDVSKPSSIISFGHIIKRNLIARQAREALAQSHCSTVIRNVRVFDGSILQPPSTVVIKGSTIEAINTTCELCCPSKVFDAQGMTLLPGLIDAHAHPMEAEHLLNLTRFGVTTAVNAFCPDPQLCASLDNHLGLASLVTGSFIATTPDSIHARLLGSAGTRFFINQTSEIPSWVAQQVAQGADLIKAIGSAPSPGLTQEEQSAIVQYAHAVGKPVIFHATSLSAFQQSLTAQADQIHHAPLDLPMDDALIATFKTQRTVSCPTLTMMRATADRLGLPEGSFAAALESVKRLHQEGVPILAGTDANTQEGTPANILFGSSLHDELENLVSAGMTSVQALNAATVVSAHYLGLGDRGVIQVGKRADLVLIDGDPTVDIAASRKIVQVWVGGLAFTETVAASS